MEKEFYDNLYMWAVPVLQKKKEIILLLFFYLLEKFIEKLDVISVISVVENPQIDYLTETHARRFKPS